MNCAYCQVRVRTDAKIRAQYPDDRPFNALNNAYNERSQKQRYETYCSVFVRHFGSYYCRRGGQVLDKSD